MGELLTLQQFRKMRDALALEEMLKRLPGLEAQRALLFSQYANRRYQLLNTVDRNERDALHYALYNKPSGEYGDAGGVAWQWQQVAAQMDNILMDARYQQYMNTQKRKAVHRA